MEEKKDRTEFGSTVSRRDFVATAAGVGLAAAGSLAFGGSALASEASAVSGSTSASASAVSATSASASAAASSATSTSASAASASSAAADDNVSPIAPLSAPSAWDKEADLVVVGTGGGGLAASLLAAQNGASVITLEKLPEIGGNTKESSYFYCPGGSKFQNENNVAFDAAATFKTYWPFYRDSADPRLMMAMISRGHITIDWLEELGVVWDFDSTFTNRSGYGLCWKGSDDDGLTIRMTKKVTDLVYQQAQDAGVDFELSTEVTGIVMDGNKVVGVRAEGEDGEFYVKADKGVILCAGGMEANRDMLEIYAPTCAKSCGASMTYPTNDGKVVRMGIGAGARVTGFDSFAIFDGGPDWEECGGSWCQSLYAGYPALLRSPWLAINEQGKRYTYLDNRGAEGNSGITGEMAATFQGMIEMGLPGNRGYVIFDKGWEERVPAFAQNGCRRPVTEDMADIDRAPESTCPHNWIDGANAAIDKGWINQSDTLEGLADELGLDAGLLTAAVDNWNSICEAGADDDPLCNYDPAWLIPVQNPPFYGAKIGGFVASCGCGLAVDTGMQVMGTDGLPIEGLYASFMTAGGAWGESGYGFASPLAVNHLSWWGGYVAAETALGLTPQE